MMFLVFLPNSNNSSIIHMYAYINDSHWDMDLEGLSFLKQSLNDAPYFFLPFPNLIIF